MSESIIGSNVRFTLDPANPPQLTKEGRDRLDAIRDQDIDLIDIPETSGRVGWHPAAHTLEAANVVRAALRRGVLMLDADVVELFQAHGDASPQKMNSVLREYVQARRKSA